MGEPYTVTEPDDVCLDLEAAARGAPDVLRSFAFELVEAELRSLGISLDVVLDHDDGVSIAAWKRAPVQTAKGPRVVVVSPQGCTSLLQAVDALKEST